MVTNDSYTKSYKEKIKQPGVEALKAKNRWGMIKRHANGAKTLLDYGCGPFALKAFQPEDHGFEKLVGFDVN
ncbi:MAG: hypothetical protein GWN00_36570, partial [Aliifodinibius sp.]|nr:hypothetical protein [Fodinibius sp.]NIV16123.1 hypothetical protein [Fodinibius sp.]NIY30103.1 hypothetical protein [Fodinibius sp.]